MEIGQQTAILYVRVSTDEQAIKGYSLKIQEETLLQYCELRNIKVRKTYVEDHSAKTFNRPAWKKLTQELISEKVSLPNFLFFTRWDRFSRNTGDAYFEIKNLLKAGIDPQAIEQPLDLAVPENKMMLAFYLAIPEVENDRRGLNVKRGLHKARMQGRWVGPAPLGYINQCLPDNSKVIIKKEPEATIIKASFEQLSDGGGSVSYTYRAAIQSGLRCSKSNFWNVLRNPVYAGNIRIANDDKTQQSIVPGLHTGIVSPATFEKVQKFLFRKKELKVYNNSFNVKFYLKGFITCPTCSRLLTGSSSTGRSAIYAYYHCSSSCGYRIRTEIIHKSFISKTNELCLTSNYASLDKSIAAGIFDEEKRKQKVKIARTLNRIDKFTERLSKAKSLLLDDHIDFNNYQVIKSDAEEKIRLLSEIVTVCSRHISALLIEKQQLLPLTGLGVFFSNLEDENKRKFLNQFLNKRTNWEDTSCNSIFHKSVHQIFGIKGSIKSNSVGEDHTLPIHFLQNMVKMYILEKLKYKIG